MTLSRGVILKKITSYPVVTGLVIKNLRTDRQFTQGQFAKIMNMTSAGWAKLERGLSALSMDKFALVSHLLELKPNELLKTVDEQVELLTELGWVVEHKRAKGDLLSQGADFVTKIAGSSTLKWQGIAASASTYNISASLFGVCSTSIAAVGSATVGSAVGSATAGGAIAAAFIGAGSSATEISHKPEDDLVFVIKLALKGVSSLETLQDINE